MQRFAAVGPVWEIAAVAARLRHLHRLDGGGKRQGLTSRRQWQGVNVIVLAKREMAIVGRHFEASQVLTRCVRTILFGNTTYVIVDTIVVIKVTVANE